jgi:hypothetical protein
MTRAERAGTNRDTGFLLQFVVFLGWLRTLSAPDGDYELC